MRIVHYILILLAGNLTAQTQFYVSTTGSNSNNGLSPATAWRTIQKAADNVVPNCVVNIAGGTYHENVEINEGGTSGNPVVFKNYLNGIVILDGTGTTGTELISIRDAGYVRIENMTLRNLTVNNANGVLVETDFVPVSSIVLKNLKVHNISWTANPDAIPTSSNNAHGISVRGKYAIWNLSITGCQIYNNTVGRSEALAVNGHVDGFVIENCQVYDNSNIGIDICGNYGVAQNPQSDQPTNGILRGNTCYDNVSPYAAAAGIYVDGAINIVIERNTVYGNEYGIEVGCEEDGTVHDITVKNNLIYENLKNGLSVGGYDQSTTGQVINSTFRNNTLYRNNSLMNGESEITITKASNCVFEDNIIYTNEENILLSAAEIQPQADNLINYNCWHTPSGGNIQVYWRDDSYQTFAQYQSGTGHDENSIYINPAFVNNLLPATDFILSAASPCINNGNPQLEISVNETDFFGNPRISGGTVDMGAFEFQSGLASFGVDATTFNAYPNPFDQNVTVKFPEVTDGLLKLYDMSGRIVSETPIHSSESITLTRNGLPSGIYFYTVYGGNKVIGSGKLLAR